MKTIKNLIGIGALALMILGVNSAQAYVPGVWDPQPRVTPNEPGFTKVPMPIDEPVKVQTTSTTYKATEVAPIKTVAITPVKKTTTVATKTNTVKNTNSNSSVNFDQNSNAYYPYDSYNNAGYSNGLTALSVAGTNSFMPDTVLEWIFVILLILAVIVIIRRLTRDDSHEVHVVSH